MSTERLEQIRGTTIVKKKDPLTYTPKRGGSKLIRTSNSLLDTIGKTDAHVVHQ